MNRTKIIEHYKKFMQLDKMQEDYQIDIDWMQAFIEDHNLVNKNDLLPLVNGWLEFKSNQELFNEEAKKNCRIKFEDGTELNYNDEHPMEIMTHFKMTCR